MLDPSKLMLWWLRYKIQQVFGLECEWRPEPRGRGFVLRCRWCGAYKAKARR